ncbi:MAG: hypothetical protein KAS94_10005 [Desulfobulbaceae bacterium]|nr:hypothetical protein [Desulfobulbaceae bacterium]
MWNELKAFLSDFADVLVDMARMLWPVLKWIVIFLAAVAVWLWNAMVMYFLITSDLIVNHYYALLIIFPILTIGFLVTNKLQTRSSIIYIPWYQDPKVLTLLLIPIIIPVLGLVVCGGPVSVTPANTNSLFPSLGLSGHLGLPTIIWAALISSLLVALTGVIALKQREKPARLVENDEKVSEEEKAIGVGPSQLAEKKQKRTI